MHQKSKRVNYSSTYREIYRRRLLASGCDSLSQSALRAAGNTTKLSDLIEVWAMIGAQCGQPAVSEALRDGIPKYSHLVNIPFKDMMKSMALEAACSEWAGSQIDFARLLERLFQTADVQEQQLILQVLPLLKSQERFIRIAAEATRTNVVPVFSSLALNNPFPHEHFDENQWNQMVLKTIFVGCDITQIIGLHERHNPALSETIFQYVSERHSAQRSVPSVVVELCERSLSADSLLQLNSIKPNLCRE